MLRTGIEMFLQGELTKDKYNVVSYLFYFFFFPPAFFLYSGKMIEFHAVN